MKVMDSSSLPHTQELNLNPRTSKSKYSLKFQNKDQENDYQHDVALNLPDSFGINPQDKYTNHMVIFYIIILIYESSYLSNYFEDHSSASTVIFQCLLLTSLTVGTSFIFYYFFIKNKVSEHKNSLLIISYTVSLLAIDFNSYLIYSKLSSNDSPTYYSILSIIPLFYTSKFTVFTSFVHYFIANSVISVVYIVINLASSANTRNTILEFALLMMVVTIESKSFYYQERSIRDKFISIHQIMKPVLKNQDSTPKTDIEEIIRNLKDSIHLVPVILQSKEKQMIYAEKIFENLSKALTLLGSRSSVYSIDLEDLEKNLDNEDKIFIQETCIQPRLSLTRNPSKYVIRKTIEVVKSYEIKDLVGILKRIGKEWNFDIFFLKDCSQNRPLNTVGCFCMQRYKIDSLFDIDFELYQSFFASLEELYKPNPYHNSAHAADVLCSFMFLVNQSRFTDFIQDYEIFAGIIAMLGHDVAHPGLTNRFMINTKHPLSLTYNDYSVLEMMHCATTFDIMKNEEKNIMRTLPKDVSVIVRGLVIEMILATDMAKHFDLVGKFNAKLKCGSIVMVNPDQRAEILRIITKASDVAHAAKSTALHQKWTGLVCEEFFNQGDREKQLNLPVSMYCDRDKTDLPKSQIGFIKNIVLPIYEAIYLGLGSVEINKYCLEQLQDNIKMWEGSSFNKRVMTFTLDIEEKEKKPLKPRNETIINKSKQSFGTLLMND